MPKCQKCRGIQLGQPAAPGHNDLDTIKYLSMSFDGTTTAKVSISKCADCGTRWYHQDDPDDPAVGWVPLN